LVAAGLQLPPDQILCLVLLPQVVVVVDRNLTAQLVVLAGDQEDLALVT
jgi:hypothetical protein